MISVVNQEGATLQLKHGDISAVIIRADGTREDLGIISSYDNPDFLSPYDVLLKLDEPLEKLIEQRGYSWQQS